MAVEFSGKFWPCFALVHMMATVISLVIMVSIMIAVLGRLCEYDVFRGGTFELPGARVNA